VVASQNVAAKNVLASLIKAKCKGMALFVSFEYYFEWHEGNYKDDIKPYLCVGEAQNDRDPLASWRRLNPGILSSFY
jgi:hypothetical protein